MNNAFDEKHNREVKWAREQAKLRTHTRKHIKVIEAHIHAKWDETRLGWGMFNERLQHWVKEEFEPEHRTFSTQERAIRWYGSLI